jgi:hypothetical protein
LSKVAKDSNDNPFKIIDIDEIPTKTSRRRAEWLQLVKQIPPGKALVTTQKEIGARPASIATTLRRYVKEGLLPDTYKVRRRRQGNTMTIYILNTGKSKEGTE